MSIAIGIYEVFSYTIPGFIYLYGGYQILSAFGIISFSPNFSEANTLFIILIISFVLGIILNPISRIWYKLFQPKNIENDVLEGLKSNYPEIEINFKASQWPVIFAHIKNKNIELTNWIDRIKAFSIMLRSLSLGLMLLAVAELINVIVYHARIQNIIWLILLIILILLSGYQSIRFNRWFYLNIFEFAISKIFKISDYLHKKSICENKENNLENLTPG